MSEPGSQPQRRPRAKTMGASRTQRFIKAMSWPNPAGMLLSLAGAMIVITGSIAVSESYPFQSTTAAPQQGSPVAVAAAHAPAAGSAVSTSSASPTASPASSSSATSSTAKAPASSAPSFKAANAIQAKAIAESTNPNSIYVLVNKRNSLKPLDYAPADLMTPSVALAGNETALLRSEAATAVEKMFAAAQADGVQINIQSSYRSYATQVGLYGSYVNQKGQASADTSSARPGYSEHQSGLALDIGDATVPASCEFTECVATTAAGLWVAQHGADYGFIVRYPNGLQGITGYLYEPWHLRYVGVAVSQDMKTRGFTTYEQYLGKAAAPGY